MDAIKAKEFLTLEPRDFANGNVRDAIYAALKEREELIKQQEPKKVTKEFVDKWYQVFLYMPMHLRERGLFKAIRQMLREVDIEIEISVG